MMQVLAPGKINLSLKILGKRNDGFHEIETLIAPISLCDEIRIEPLEGRKRIEFHCDDRVDTERRRQSRRACGQSIF